MQTSTLEHAPSQFADILRDWRQRRRLSQLALGLDAGVSARHISFLEGGRSRPSRDMVERLADGLDMPIVERNAMMAAAGFTPRYRESALSDDHLAPARMALTRMMDAHAPYPAILFDRHWTAVGANPVGQALLTPGGSTDDEPVNMIEMLLTDDALRARLVNWPEIARAMRTRLLAESRHAGGDQILDAFAQRLEAQISALPVASATETAAPFLSVQLDLDGIALNLFSTVAEISSPYDVTLADLRLELFFPADEATRAILEG